jgi:Tol biopolymer transport system component
VDATTTDIYTARLDLARKTATFEPEPIAQHNTGANSYPSWSPDGESFVYLSSPDTGGRQIYTHESSGAERSLMPVLSWFNRLEWLRTGQVAITGGDQSGHEGIFGIDSRTGETKQLIDRSVNETAFHGQWTKDGQTYYGRRRSAADGVYRLDVRTGVKKSLFMPMAGWQAQGGVLSPDERTLALEIIPKAPTEPGRILLIDTGSGKAHELMSNSAATHFPCCRPMTWTADSQNLIVVSGDERNRTLFLAPVNGASPKALLSMPGLANPHLNRDNVRLLFEMGDSHQEIWQIEGSALE